MKYKLHNIRESKIWKEAYAEGYQLAMIEVCEKMLKARIENGHLSHWSALVEKWLQPGRSIEEIAELLDMPVELIQQCAETFPVK